MLHLRLTPSLAGLVLLLGCSTGGDKAIDQGPAFQKPDPKGYVCYRTAGPIVPDGILSESEWSLVPWTDFFADIEGASKPVPRFSTRAKLLWNDEYLYIAAELEEPHLWGRLKLRDTVIFYDHDFEVFIDPDGDTHNYYELEINALGTPWDLLLIKPYRDGGPAVYAWNYNGMQVGVHLKGTLNNPADTDTSWTAELALPMSILKECTKGSSLPVAGDQWRINFSRVEWRTLIDNGTYKKELNPSTGKPYPEDNWVWSPQGVINMHMPEMWGYLQFSGFMAGQGSEQFIPDPDLDIKWALRQVYYGEFNYYERNKKYTRRIKDLGLIDPGITALISKIRLSASDLSFTATLPAFAGNKLWVIDEEGRIRSADL